MPNTPHTVTKNPSLSPGTTGGPELRVESTLRYQSSLTLLGRMFVITMNVLSKLEAVITFDNTVLLFLALKKLLFLPGVVVHIYNPSTQQAEAGEVQCQPRKQRCMGRRDETNFLIHTLTQRK